MATGAASDGIFRGIFEGSISGHDLEISKRPYHRNCGCALHKSRGNCSHSSRYMHVSYPIKRSWSEGCLSLMAAAAASGHTSPCTSPAVSTATAAVGKRNLVAVNEDEEDLVFSKV
ncbi:putative serine/threonine-protein phosphatase 7 long form -like protein [Capsicum annuum]|uniref:uncharacterized protein LOC107841806 n=1 Tax=Capsicum annuum TaxID=4072 RepID=UPI0007BEC865|nr:uncharacterized protein LOC107841806 [Capsicum annuum]KAF3633640.1 putative serine/threonine-protein phosphatase 7 long form -like protein [Capsicum annuum]KAF3643454.1 putative serine/threonine-protein phosphatase 7 long form -like protein [Capsicum annuum]